MTIQEIITAVFKVYDPADAPKAKGRRNQLSSARRVVAHLARAYLPHLSLCEIRNALHMHAHSSVHGMLAKPLTLAEAKAFAAAEKELGVGSREPIPAPASMPRMTDKAREIIGVLNAEEDVRRDVVGYLRAALTVSETLHRATAQQRVDRENQPATVQGAK